MCLRMSVVFFSNPLISKNLIKGQENMFCARQSQVAKELLPKIIIEQAPFAQGKLYGWFKLRCFDVWYDIRKDSPTYGQWVVETLSAENYKQLWIPEGFAHGFLTLSDEADFLYKKQIFIIKNMSVQFIGKKDFNIEWPSLESIFLNKKISNILNFINTTN